MKRRTLLQLAAAGAAAAALPAFGRKIKPLKILILGGTRFIGLHMTSLALERGHSVTFFNRGKTKSDRFPEVERIKGDRNGEIDGLKDRDWDVVIDNSGYVPRHVKLSAELLAQRVKQYVFTSSISVYPDFSVPRDEAFPVGNLADEATEKVDGETYGPLKALCDQAAEPAIRGRTCVPRPGLPCEPADPPDRFTHGLQLEQRPGRREVRTEHAQHERAPLRKAQRLVGLQGRQRRHDAAATAGHGRARGKTGTIPQC
jgi:2'-hydroxyisoflavone reductase